MSEQHRLGEVAVEVHRPEQPFSGVPVVLLHGIGGGAASFAGVAPRLAAAGWLVIAWDAPGYGASPDPGPGVTGEDSPAVYVDLVAGVLADLGLPRVHLAGVSWGGVIATHVAQRRPDLVASLTLIDSTRGSGTSAEKAAAMRGRVSELAEAGSAAFAERRAPRLLAADATPATRAEVTRQMAAVRLAGYAGAAEMMAQSDTGGELARITAPTLVLVGDEDQVTGVEESRLLADRIPGARFGLVARAGHAAVQERPEEVATAMQVFLTDVETATPRATGAVS